VETASLGTTRTHASAMTGPDITRLAVWADTAAPLKEVHDPRSAGVKPADYKYHENLHARG